MRKMLENASVLVALVVTWLLVLLVLALSAQQPDPPPRHDRYGKDDPHAYCLAGKPLDEHGHECSCKPPPCLANGERDPNAREDATCISHCFSPACVCHADSACAMKGM